MNPDNDNVAIILSQQNNPETKEIFKDIKDGDIIKLRDPDELDELDDLGLVNSSWVHGMQEVKEMNEVVFHPNEWCYDGSTYRHGWNWSLDMYVYSKPYKVELL